ncbi:hypothetical protein [Myroides sp. WP-1]|uniref:hypothetical protein n=1 Tax=Myroides sp. WP-1 TaxID=2759944 RepID=UPI0021062EAD|nr:hypothetical protein [Myroides sp. WP-1]
MKIQLPKLNYSLLTYLIASIIGMIFFFNNNTDGRYLYLLLSVALVMILSTSCFHALTFRSYRSVLWPFILNMVLLIVYVIANEGIGNTSFFGSNNVALTLFFTILGFNSHWYILLNSAPLSDFNFLLINVVLSFIIPSLGYVSGYIYTSKIKQKETSTYSNS